MQSNPNLQYADLLQNLSIPEFNEMQRQSSKKSALKSRASLCFLLLVQEKRWFLVPVLNTLTLMRRKPGINHCAFT